MGATARKRKRSPAGSRTHVRRARVQVTRETPATLLTDAQARLYDFAPAIYVLLDSSGIIDDINTTGTRLLGAPRSRFIGLPFRLLVAQDDRREFLDHLHRCRTSADVIETELKLTAADGGSLAARLYTRQTHHEGRLVFPTIAVDLTEQRFLEHARSDAERQRDEAERARQLAQAGEAAKDRLIAMVSHELRNPLSPILVAAEVLVSSREFPERVRQLGAVVKRNIELESRLIRDLIDVAKVTRGQLKLRLEPTDLHAVVLDAVDACSPAAQARTIAIVLDFQASRHHVRGDASRLQQVFWNLLNNAIKFSDPGGRIIVRTTSDSDEVIRVTIRDFGAGIDADLLAGLFQPFAQNREGAGHRGGLGLGLTISTGIVEGHGGRIWATSQGPGFGATFEVEFATCDPPVSEEEGSEPARDASMPGGWSATASAPRVLIVEDHHDTAALLGMFLSSQGYEVTVAQTVSDAMSLLNRDWTAVLSDIGLADGSGLEIARRARRLPRPPARMVALSGYGAPTDVAASKEAGFDEHLVKPIDLDELLEAITPARTERPLRGAAPRA